MTSCGEGVIGFTVYARKTIQRALRIIHLRETFNPSSPFPATKNPRSQLEVSKEISALVTESKTAPSGAMLMRVANESLGAG